MNVVRFPVCRNIDGLHWYGGCGYQTSDAVKAAMSDRDWRRVVDWEGSNAAWIASKQPRGGDKQRGGAA